MITKFYEITLAEIETTGNHKPKQDNGKFIYEILHSGIEFIFEENKILESSKQNYQDYQGMSKIIL